MAAAEPDDPQDAVVAKQVSFVVRIDVAASVTYRSVHYRHPSHFPAQYKEQPDTFKLTATHWSNAYAGAPAKVASYDDLVQKLVDMGIQEVSLLVLSRFNVTLVELSIGSFLEVVTGHAY